MQIVAHRGVSAAAPENTMAALKLAAEQGCTGVEFDVRLTRDCLPVLLHDPDLLRTAGVEARVEDLVYSELARMDVGRWKGDEWLGEPVPLLRDVVQQLPDSVDLFIEIKTGPETVPSILQEIPSGDPRCFRLLSKHADTLDACRKLRPDLPVVWVVNLLKVLMPEGSFPDVRSLVDKAVESGYAGLGPRWCERLTEDSAREAKRAGLYLMAWTVDCKSDAERAASWGIDALVSNDPQQLV